MRSEIRPRMGEAMNCMRLKLRKTTPAQKAPGAVPAPPRPRKWLTPSIQRLGWSAMAWA